MRKVNFAKEKEYSTRFNFLIGLRQVRYLLRSSRCVELRSIKIKIVYKYTKIVTAQQDLVLFIGFVETRYCASLICGFKLDFAEY